jgi:type IV pilus assembly protein PilW
MAMTRTLITRRSSRRAAMGFSLIELMVASTVGLLVTLAVTGSVLTMGRQFSVLGSNVSAQGSAQIGLALIDSTGRTAGAGFYSDGRMLCPTWNAWNGTAIVSNGAVFMPARIVSGGSNTASDTLVFTAGSGTGPLSSAPVMTAGNGASIKVSTAANLATGDFGVIGIPGGAVPCTLFEVSQAPNILTTLGGCDGKATRCAHLINNPSGLNPNPNTFTNEPTYGFTSAGGAVGPAVINRVGTVATGFRQNAFGVQCNSLVRFNAFVNATVPACTSTPLAFGAGVDAIATGIVQMHAQYGVSNSGDSDVVTAWVEPTGATWGAPSAANVARIKAVRVVIVARSSEPDGAEVSSACTSVPGGVVNTGPCSFQDAAAPVIDLSATTVAAGKTWRNYRYGVHQAVIPLTSVIWSDS